MSEALTATLPVPASATARAWLDRLHALQELRVQFADAPDFQRWVIQARVLRFLLNAHASDPWLDDLPSPSPIAEPFINLFAGAGKPPRSAETIRSVLEVIAEYNRENTLRLKAQARMDALEHQQQKARAVVFHAEIVAELRERLADEALEQAAAEADGDDAHDEWWLLYWPEIPPGFTGLCVAGPLGLATFEAVTLILDGHLPCGHDMTMQYARQLNSTTPFLIATDVSTAYWLAADLRGVGLHAAPII